MLKQLLIIITNLLFTTALFSQDASNIEFIENKGQWASDIKYLGKTSGGLVLIRSAGFSIVQHDAAEYAQMLKITNPHNSYTAKDSVTVHSNRWDIDFQNISPQAELVAEKKSEGSINYFIGNDPTKWASNCNGFYAIVYKNIYPGIDIRYYTSNHTLKYDVIASPGADVSRVALKYTGVENIRVRNSLLELKTKIGKFLESYPFTYQPGKEGVDEVKCKYHVKDNIVRFDVSRYDTKRSLVIDPSLIFCSLSKSTEDNWGFTATYGSDGSFYGGGIVFGNGFPTNTGAFQTTYKGGSASGNEKRGFDIGIIKLSPTGGTRVYATYIGGTTGNEQPHSLIVDDNGNVVLAGRTNSAGVQADEYPQTGPIIGSGGGYDIVVTKLNTTGSALLGSRKIGGSSDDGVNIDVGRGGISSLMQNYGDDGRSEIILDRENNVYIASSASSYNFPVTSQAFQRIHGGKQDAVVLKLDPNLNNLIFASYLGGSSNDAGYVISLSPSNDIFIGGGTESSDFTGSHSGTVGPSPLGNIDGYVARISNDGSTIFRSAYIGTNGADQVFGLKFDSKGYPYITGQTTGKWNIINAPYNNPTGKQFISKLQPDLSSYVYSTAFGSGGIYPNISITAFLVDRCENVYVSGWGGKTANSNFNLSGTSGLPVTADALQANTDGNDFYFFVLKKNAVSQLYGSFFGQTGGYTDHVDGGTSRFDPNGIIYQAVCANCEEGNPTRFPTTPGAWATTKPSSAFCNMGMFKIAFNLSGVSANIQSFINEVALDTFGCVPLTVRFEDRIKNAREYIWNFGDGGNGPVSVNDPLYNTLDTAKLGYQTGYTVSHTFNKIGTYRVRLIAIDSSSCNINDTAFINIKVSDIKANLQAMVTKLQPCEDLNYRFENNSTNTNAPPFTNNSFSWDFGDGSLKVATGLGGRNHRYKSPGTYNALLILNDSLYCNYPDTLPLTVRVAINIVADFSTPAAGCAPYRAKFTNESTGGQQFKWEIFSEAPDGSLTSIDTSALINPTFDFNTIGTYKIQMIAIDSNTCNITDTLWKTVVVYDKPTASFTYTPINPKVNTPNVFTNTSSANATRFLWIFGDGDTAWTNSAADVTHQYNKTGIFNACLIAYNAQGCSDTFCLPVETIVTPLLDVPNAFTPNRKDENSVIMVRSFGVDKITFIIYNRWGQKVFETNNAKQGWDGTYKGALQPMDVYIYTVNAIFFDGKRAIKKGDITLIR